MKEARGKPTTLNFERAEVLAKKETSANRIFSLLAVFLAALERKTMKCLRNTTFRLTVLGSALIFIWVLYTMKLKPHAMSAQCTTSESTVSTESSPSNPLHDLEVYVRYTTAGKLFPKQAEAWLFRSMSLFWPKNPKVVVVLDKENEADRNYGSTLNETTSNKKLNLRVCYMEPYPKDIIHNWGKMRMYFDMMHADFCTNATYVGLVDVDTLFTTAVTPSLILEDGKPVVTGRIGHPKVPCWIQSGEYVLGVKQVMQCMHYFPVTFKTAHIREFRKYVAKLHGKDFKDVVSEATTKLKIRDTCYCHYSMMCNYMWYHHRHEYAWHLQYVKPTRPSSATVPNEYFATEVKLDEKVPHPRSSQHIRHYMLNGIYMNAKVPSERFVNDTLVEGLCYSFGLKLCSDLCKGYNETSIHVNLFNFADDDWLWDSRCMEKQIEHYQNVSILFDKKFFYLDSREEVCNTIRQLSDKNY